MDANGNSTREPILVQAWRRQAELDANAGGLGNRYIDLRKWVAILGIFATFLAIFMEVTTLPNRNLEAVLKVILIATPLTASLIAAFTGREMGDGRWLTMRAGAEEILKEIYIYRTVLSSTVDRSRRNLWLSNRLATILRQVYKSSSNKLDTDPYKGELPPYYNSTNPDSDPGFNDLTAAEYLRYRLQDQIHWHESRLVRLRRNKWILTVSILAMGALGALLAGIGGGFAVWVALTASITAALTGWEELRNREATIANYSKVKLELGILNDYWAGLNESEKSETEFYKLVVATENLLWVQNAEYIRSMQEALSAFEDEDAKLVEDVVRHSESMHKQIQKTLYSETVDVMDHTTERVTTVIHEAGDSVEGMVTTVSEETIAYTDSAGRVVDKAVAESTQVRVHAETSAGAEVEAWGDTAEEAVDTVAAASAAVRDTAAEAVTDEAAAWRDTAEDGIDRSVAQSEEARKLAEAEVDAWEETSDEALAAAAAASADARETASTEIDAWQESAEAATERAASQSEAIRTTADQAVDTAAGEAAAWNETAQDSVKAAAQESEEWRETTEEAVDTAVAESTTLREGVDTAVKYGVDFAPIVQDIIEEAQEIYENVVYQAKADVKYPVNIESEETDDGNDQVSEDKVVDRIIEEGLNTADETIKEALAKASKDEEES